MRAACATIVERDDPHLYATALFAPEPARSSLMVLYAFDCELSRAVRSSKESMIPRMRLQWWRDVVEEAAQGAVAKSHEVASPLHAIIQDHATVGLGDDLTALIHAHAQVLDLPWSPEQEPVWRQNRFQRLVAAACKVLTGTRTEPPEIGPAMADAFALRHAHRMAALGDSVPLPNIVGSNLAALARGELRDSLRKILIDTAESGLRALHGARCNHPDTDARMIPALLPVLSVERTLSMVQRDPGSVFGQLDDIDRPFDGLKLAWRAARGRW